MKYFFSKRQFIWLENSEEFLVKIQIRRNTEEHGGTLVKTEEYGGKWRKTKEYRRTLPKTKEYRGTLPKMEEYGGKWGKTEEFCLFLQTYFSCSKSNFHASFIWDFRVLCNYVRRCGQNDPIVLVFVCFPTFMSQGRGCPQFLRNWGQRSGTKILASPKHCSATELPIFTIFLLFFCYFFVTFEKNKRQLTSSANQRALMVMAT